MVACPAVVVVLSLALVLRVSGVRVPTQWVDADGRRARQGSFAQKGSSDRQRTKGGGAYTIGSAKRAPSVVGGLDRRLSANQTARFNWGWGIGEDWGGFGGVALGSLGCLGDRRQGVNSFVQYFFVVGNPYEYSYSVLCISFCISFCLLSFVFF